MKQEEQDVLGAPWLKQPLRAGAVALCLAVGVSVAGAADVPPTPDLSNLSIEELANIEVSSVSKRAEPLSKAAAAIFVITAEDIRRSGAPSLPEVLRLAPNLEVARVNAYSYAITARGFNSPDSSNKLLVLVDGRSVYSPLYSTVFWENVNVPLDNIERIEVISGPGGTLWGANAVNGVINIITWNANDTQGNLVDLGVGTADRNGMVRSGAKIGENTAFRVYANGFNRVQTTPASNTDLLNDNFWGEQGGFRVDGGGNADKYTLQGDLYRNKSTESPGTPSTQDYKLSGGNMLGRWTHQLDGGSSVQVQAYFAQDNRVSPVYQDLLDTYDIQAQHNIDFGIHRFVWGGDYRLWDEGLFTTNTPFFFQTPRKTLTLADLFGQDEITLPYDLKLTVGLKAENDTFSGTQFMPNLRLAWQASTDALFWGAVSQAVRTPSRIDREFQAKTFLDRFLAPSDFQPERVTAYELGFRGQPDARSTISISTFYNVYHRLRTDALTPTGFLGVYPLVLSNGLAGDTYGVEIWGSYRVLDWWRLRPGFNWLHKNLSLDPGATDASGLAAAGLDPSYQAQIRSEMNLSDAWELDASLRNIGSIDKAQIASYFEADLRVGWHLTNTTELSLNGSNLLHAHHIEAIDTGTVPPRYLSRSVYLSLRTSF